MIKIGIIGTSSISQKFCQAVNIEEQKGAKINLHANYSRSITKAIDFRQDYGINLSFDDKLEMFKVIDLVYIATPNSLHYNDVKLALSMGVHVIVEKPMTLSSEQTNELFELAKTNNLVLVEAIKTCSMASYQQALELLPEIGPITSFRFNMMRSYNNFPQPDQEVANIYKREMDGGVIADLGSYALFPLIDFVFPDISNIMVKAITNTFGAEVETEVLANITDQQTSGIISLSMHTADNSLSYIYGTDGYLTIDSLSQFNQVKFYNNNHMLATTFVNNDDHLMSAELRHTIDLIESNQLASDMHNQHKSVLVAKLLEQLTS